MIGLDTYFWIVFAITVLSIIGLIWLIRRPIAEKNKLEHIALTIWLMIVTTLGVVGNIGYILSKIL